VPGQDELLSGDTLLFAAQSELVSLVGDLQDERGFVYFSRR
jgi:hypothetical protein